jgi:iron complex outermembrane recepter protein
MKKELGSGYANDGGYYELRHEKDLSQTGKVVANINTNITQNLTTNIMLGGEMWKQERSFTRVATDGGLIVPGRFFLDNSKRTKVGGGAISGTNRSIQLIFLPILAGRMYCSLMLQDVTTGHQHWYLQMVQETIPISIHP